jgi:hypothetical protein
LPTSSAFSRAARTSSVSALTCLLAFLNCLPALPTCFATPFSPLPVPGIGTPRTFFGFFDILLPRTAPPTRPAAPVTTPTTTEVFDELEFELDFARVALLPPLGFELPLRDDELPLRDDDDGDRRLEALAFERVLLAVLRDRDELLADLPFEEPLERLLCAPDFDPLELRDVCFVLLDERLLA